MKTIVVYYTFGGSTKKEAERIAAEWGADLCRVKEAKKRGLIASFIPGGLQAMKRKAVAVLPLDVSLRDYDRIIIGCPVWAGFPAPAFNSVLELLPAGKEVELFLCSGSGDSSKSAEETKTLIENKGCRLVCCRDVRTYARPGKIKE